VFTGIIETTATIAGIETEGSNKHFTLTSHIASELKVDQSIAHNGVCLTVTEIVGNQYKVTAIDETLQKTTLAHWQLGHVVNLERCMPANGRYDGHIVQGHVDTVATCEAIENQQGSWMFTFKLSTQKFNELMVDKGSICINGISLTIVHTQANQFSVAIIPYTFEHTNMNQLKTGSLVNIEFDILGKYIQKMLLSRGQSA
jgi:riboflavin synthase